MADSGQPAPAPDDQVIRYVSVRRLLAAEYPTAVQLALHAGWTMATLYGELGRLRLLLTSLWAKPECADSGWSFTWPEFPVDISDFRQRIATPSP
jgi:hypothetical protein